MRRINPVDVAEFSMQGMRYMNRTILGLPFFPFKSVPGRIAGQVSSDVKTDG